MSTSSSVDQQSIFTGGEIEKSPNAEVVMDRFETPSEIPRSGEVSFSGDVEFVEELDIEDVSPFISVWRTRDEAVNTESQSVTNTDGFVRFPEESKDTPIPGSFSFTINANAFPNWVYDRTSVWVAIHGWNLTFDPAFGAVEVPVQQPTGDPEPVLESVRIQEDDPVPGGSTVTAELQVTNRGDAEASDVPLTLEVVDADESQTFDTLSGSVDSVQPGGTATVVFDAVPVPRLSDLSRSEFLLVGQIDGGPTERRFVDVEKSVLPSDLEVVQGSIRIAEIEKVREDDPLEGEPKITGVTLEWDVRNNTRFQFTVRAEARSLSPSGTVMDTDKEAVIVAGNTTATFSSNLDIDGEIGSFDVRLTDPVSKEKVSSSPEVIEVTVRELEFPDSVSPGEGVNVGVVLEAVGNTSGSIELEIEVDGEVRGTKTFTGVQPGTDTRSISITAPQDPGGANVCVRSVSPQ